jgi:hypothetical protein
MRACGGWAVPVAKYGNAGGRGEESVIADEAEGVVWVLNGGGVCAAWTAPVARRRPALSSSRGVTDT